MKNLGCCFSGRDGRWLLPFRTFGWFLGSGRRLSRHRFAAGQAVQFGLEYFNQIHPRAISLDLGQFGEQFGVLKQGLEIR
jgi:hypothetical protein